MYDNIGKKIRTLAKVLFTISAAFCILGGAVFLFYGMSVLNLGFCLLGCAVAILGTFLAYVSSWRLYGFGELIEKVSRIEKTVRLFNTEEITSSDQPTTDPDSIFKP